jgi:hypothetical protein
MKNGHFGSTQENAWALMALGRAFAASNAAVKVEVTANGQPYRTLDGRDLSVADVGLTGKKLKLTNAGAATAYYHLMAEGTPLAKATKPRAAGLSVTRTYRDTQGREVNLSNVPQGDLVVVSLLVTAAKEARNVVVVDLLPGGFEIENPRLRSRGDLGFDPPGGFNAAYQDIRDDRILLFTEGFTGERAVLLRRARGDAGPLRRAQPLRRGHVRPGRPRRRIGRQAPCGGRRQTVTAVVGPGRRRRCSPGSVGVVLDPGERRFPPAPGVPGDGLLHAPPGPRRRPRASGPFPRRKIPTAPSPVRHVPLSRAGLSPLRRPAFLPPPRRQPRGPGPRVPFEPPPRARRDGRFDDPHAGRQADGAQAAHPGWQMRGNIPRVPIGARVRQRRTVGNLLEQRSAGRQHRGGRRGGLPLFRQTPGGLEPGRERAVGGPAQVAGAVPPGPPARSGPRPAREGAGARGRPAGPVGRGPRRRARRAAPDDALSQPAALAPLGGARPPGDAPGWVRRYAVDPQLQRFCEDRLAHAARRLRRHGVHNGAVLVVENATRRALAYVGSPDFDDAVARRASERRGDPAFPGIVAEAFPLRPRGRRRGDHPPAARSRRGTSVRRLRAGQFRAARLGADPGGGGVGPVPQHPGRGFGVATWGRAARRGFWRRPAFSARGCVGRTRACRWSWARFP